jgi:hypothetical protein
MRPSPLLATLAALLVSAPAGALRAQYRSSEPPPRGVPVRVALTVAGQPAASRGEGVCYHRPDFALHGHAAQQWSVRYDAKGSGGGSDAPVGVDLSVMVPQGAATGPFAATLATHGKRRRIGVGTPRPVGSGTVLVAAEGTGWRFTFDARTADGAPVTGTVTCERTSPLGGRS